MLEANKLLFTIEETQKVIGLGRSRIYELLQVKELEAVKSGKRTLITAESIKRFVASLPSFKGGADNA